jgi:hypothetical protein
MSTCSGWPFANAREYHRRTHPAQLRLVSPKPDMTARRTKAGKRRRRRSGLLLAARRLPVARNRR